MRLYFIVCFLFVSGIICAQHSGIVELGPKGTMTRAVDVTQLQDGSFLSLISEQNMNYPPFYTAPFLLHTSSRGDSLERLDIGNPLTHIMYINFFRRNDSLLIQGITAPDSVLPHYSRKGAFITTLYIHTYPLYLVPVSMTKIETAFSVYTQKFKALNWYYSPDLGYDAEICRFQSDSGTGYKINHPGVVTIKMLLETLDGGLFALGDVSYNERGSDYDLYALKLDSNLVPVWENSYGLTKGRQPAVHVKPNSERLTYFITTNVISGDTVTDVQSRMVADTISGHSQEMFISACLSSDQGILLLANVSMYNVGQSYFVSSIDPKGNLKWSDCSFDTVPDSTYYYSAGTQIVSMPAGDCMIVGYRNPSADPEHRELFTRIYTREGKMKREASLFMRDKWLHSAHIIQSGRQYHLFGDHLDGLINGTFVPFIVHLNRRGEFQK
jgi:hypothetical protein